MGATPGNDSRYSAEKIESKRNFINKLWNISRFILSATEEKYFSTPSDKIPEAKTLADEWILGEMNKLIKSVTERLENFEFSLAAEELNEFTWNKLADWYLEMAKVEKDKEVILIYLLKNILILWHPFIPFVTETIWDSFNEDFLMIATWPKAQEEIKKDNSQMMLIQDIVVAIRNARSENKIEPAKKLEAVIYGHKMTSVIDSQKEIIKNLKTGLSNLEVKEKGEAIAKAIMVPLGEVTIYLVGAVDEAKEKERLIKEQANLEKLILMQEQKLNNSDFVSRAPEKIVAAEKGKLNNYKQELNKTISIINSL
jgi:valyl-tRNA synthetase